ncbi:SusD/RagB family nutrient-binding outer membrane lipoprotein [uncultured Polaribacter sp.]|uniref:SusD/RagB family nutrient-binding outer membrane lipoprotein n=1 Tax=uncultured Polaribacter sp. TaxID=174711 RepID=UPI00263114DB|nr:SusD/RagB family nutrient-binding outer membrane lipoprotein [uncultured Polaribacter sp.]
MKTKFLKYFSISLISIFMASSCETTKLELLDSPNALTESSADVDFYLSSIQITMSDFFENITEEGMELTRILHFFGPTYENGYAASQLNNAWSNVYSGVLPDARALVPLAIEQELYTHAAIAQIAEAYMVGTLVDYIGDIPYTESNDGVSLNPVADLGSEIYPKLIALLDEAIVNLGKTESVLPSTDLYYDGDEAKWTKLANTLKLKFYLQTRLVDDVASEINAIVASGNYIQSSDDDFFFQYSSTDTDPDSRHPIFARNFVEGSGVTDYMSNHYMNELVHQYSTGKTVVDPRTRYYFYRQRSTSSETTVEQACYGTLPPDHYGFAIPYCTLTDGYWGRDHGDDGGIPPDTSLRATWGVYPVGGPFDEDTFVSIADRNVGLVGQGISPIMMSSYVDFMLAEAALTIGTTGDARTYLENGITKSIDKVINFGSSIANSSYVPDAAYITSYIDEVLALYDAAATNDEKLNIIVKEYFIALYGNGIEAYNTFRRTGMPDNLQPLRKSVTTQFVNSFFYPSDYVNQNSNATQKTDVYQTVFWDN